MTCAESGKKIYGIDIGNKLRYALISYDIVIANLADRYIG